MRQEDEAEEEEEEGDEAGGDEELVLPEGMELDPVVMSTLPPSMQVIYYKCPNQAVLSKIFLTVRSFSELSLRTTCFRSMFCLIVRLIGNISKDNNLFI